MKITFTIFFLALLSSLAAQKPESPAQTQVEIVTKPVDSFLAAISISRSSITDLTEWIEEWEELITTESAATTANNARTSNLNFSKSNRQMRVNLNSSKSNIRHVSIKLDHLESSDSIKRSAALVDLHKALADLELSIQELYTSILNRGENYAKQAAELKSRHETVKNSIQNIR